MDILGHEVLTMGFVAFKMALEVTKTECDCSLEREGAQGLFH